MAILVIPSARPRWLVDHSCIRTTRAQNAPGISSLVESGFRQMDVDCCEAGRRRRHAVNGALFWLLEAGGAWVVVESAWALSMF